MLDESTIVAVATPPGRGAIAVIRLSGSKAISIASQLCKGSSLALHPSHKTRLCLLQHDGETIDEALVTCFHAPRSFTGENVVEIAPHGAPYVVRRILHLLVLAGARPARAGEFSQRAFLQGKFDLTQAEAIADLIAAENKAAHQIALHQMRGGFSATIAALRAQLIAVAATIELTLDFAEEDVTHSTNQELLKEIAAIKARVTTLCKSFAYHQVIKEGLPTVLMGRPNAGKSTLLNALLQEEKALVSAIPGTTRDAIEDRLQVGDAMLRIIDTAGLREDVTDEIEAMGVARTHAKIASAGLLIPVFDLTVMRAEDVREALKEVAALGKPYIAVGNKVDLVTSDRQVKSYAALGLVLLSAKQQQNLSGLTKAIEQAIATALPPADNVVIVNARHYDALGKVANELTAVQSGLEAKVSNEFLMPLIRSALDALGSITGDVSTEEILGNIFSRFCIGK